MNRHAESHSFDVVFVCTGNRARSALGEALYRRHTTGVDTRARSFGTLDVGDAPALAHAVEAARTLGADISAHTAAALSHGVLAEADLVLGFEPHHVSAAVVDANASAARTFLLREIVELLEPAADSVSMNARARAAVAAADERRAERGSNVTRLTIPDPVQLGRPARGVYKTAIEIDELVRQLVRGLFRPREDIRPPIRE